MDYQHHLYQIVTRTFFTKAVTFLIYKEIFCLLCNSVSAIFSLSRGEKSILVIFLKYGLLWSVVSDGLAREQGRALEIDASTQIVWKKTTLENATISGLSWRILPLKEIFLVSECFDLYSSTQDIILFKANVHHNILRKKYIFSAIGDFSTVRNNPTS